MIIRHITIFLILNAGFSLQAMIARSPLERAIYDDDIKGMVKILSKSPDSVNSERRYGGALIDTCESIKAMKTLIKYGADINKKNDDSGYPFIHYIDRPEFIIYMLNNGLDLNKNNEVIFTYLSHALKNPEVFKLLLKKSADHTVVNSEGQNLYHIAAKRGYQIEQLSGLKGIDINKIDNYGFPPLYYSINHEKAFKDLVKNGAKPYKKVTELEMSLYHHIYLNEKFELMQYVPIAEKILIKLKNAEGYNPLEALAIKYKISNYKPVKKVKDLIDNKFPTEYDLFNIIDSAYKKNTKYYDYEFAKQEDPLWGFSWHYQKFNTDQKNIIRKYFEEKLSALNNDSLRSVLLFFSDNKDSLSKIKDIELLEMKSRLYNNKFGKSKSKSGSSSEKFIIKRSKGSIQLLHTISNICY